MDWSTLLTIAVWIFFAVMILRGGGCCGMGGHKHGRRAPNDDRNAKSGPAESSGHMH